MAHGARAIGDRITDEASLHGERAMAQVKDPVCGMTMKEADVVGTSEYQGTHYFFCSAGCKAQFDAAPEKYARKG